MHPAFSVLVGGILPFGAVFIELFFILTSMWLQQFYYLFGFLCLVFVILVVTCAEISVVLCYFQLCSEDYRWWCAPAPCRVTSYWLVTASSASTRLAAPANTAGRCMPGLASSAAGTAGAGLDVLQANLRRTETHPPDALPCCGRWRAYFTSGSSALYLLAYSLFYFYTRLDITRVVPMVMYFCYMTMISVSFFCLTGTIGFYGARGWALRACTRTACPGPSPHAPQQVPPGLTGAGRGTGLLTGRWLRSVLHLRAQDLLRSQDRLSGELGGACGGGRRQCLRHATGGLPQPLEGPERGLPGCMCGALQPDWDAHSPAASCLRRVQTSLRQPVTGRGRGSSGWALLCLPCQRPAQAKLALAGQSGAGRRLAWQAGR